MACWGLGQRGWLGGSGISRLRNMKFENGPTIRHLAALAAANHACWLWQVKGEAAAIKALGPHGAFRLTAPQLKQAIWLPIPGTDAPLAAGDWLNLALGRLELPYVGAVECSPREAARATARLCDLLNAEVRHLPLREAMTTIMRAYPVQEPHRRTRLRELVLSQQTLSPADLEEELLAFSELIGTLRGQALTPADLMRELQESRSRSA